MSNTRERTQQEIIEDTLAIAGKVEEGIAYIKESNRVLRQLMNRIYNLAQNGQLADDKDATLKRIQAEAAAWLGYEDEPPLIGYNATESTPGGA